MIAFLLAAAATNAAMAFEGQEIEAEQSATTGTAIGPDLRFGTLAAEASGRRAVRLDDQRQSVEITLPAPANGITIRYAIPDSADGKGLNGRLQLWAGSKQLTTVPLTSRYSWYYGKYPFSNRTSDGRGHRFWDETRVLLPQPLAAGVKLRLVPVLDDTLRWIAIDLVDLENVPAALGRPSAAMVVTDFGADTRGRTSSRGAFERAIRAARRKGRQLYVPPGLYRIDGHLVIDRIHITGAGPWYSVIAGRAAGLYARKEGSSNVAVSGIAIESDVAERKDRLPLAAVGGTFSRSRFSDMFLHHAKVGVWLDGPAQGIVLERLRITDQAADGINLHRGIRDALVRNNFIRNVGDDGIASWSDRIANRNVEITGNRIIAPTLANGIAIYGGRDIRIADNYVADVLTQGGGIHLGSRFHSAPFAGRIEISGNTIVRSGSMDPNWRFGIGSLWLYAQERPIAATIQVSGNRIIDPPCEAVQVLGPHRIGHISIDELRIEGSVAPVMALQTLASMSVRAVFATPPNPHPVKLPEGLGFTDKGGNSGWRTVAVASPAVPACK